MATIDRYYFRVCTDGALQRGVDVDALLRAAGIDPANLDMPGWRGDVTAMARLVAAIRATMDDEFMGYTAHAMPPGAFAFACEIALDAPDVAAALTRAARFYTLATRDIETRVEPGERVKIVARFADPGLDPTRYFSEFWLITWHRLACWLAGETVPMLAATFDYPRPRDYFEEFKYLFPCPHRFNAGERSIELDAHALAVPIRRTRADLAAMLARAPLDMMTIPASDTGLARRVRLLLAADPARDGDAVAHALGIGPDTLRRRLRGEGMALSAIRENVRRDAAMRQLSLTGQSVEAVAAALGYAEPRSFTRAFRQWTGMSPSEFRRGGA
ncbi:AraC family transcriptional regulator [Sphingomonas immobilis]|uniref:AraC family transcriptional regulator ligand-binding domain-containing protein n=1 Tax=Sphingomonas immobilis TaxID=3063997 RepID=A0ABT8ZXJ7_9SPHN|nr:AraC family transcriptional regulator [Sphingomonas sp. CA1-15]MDO7842296.1 AraC family transcriptional regulator ligand-binding domain-containing protein [Sphingomonas sp. CA1-15]